MSATRPLLQQLTAFFAATALVVGVFWIVVSGQQAQNNYLSEKAAHAKASQQVDALIKEQRFLINEIQVDNADAAVERLHSAENLQLVLDYAKAMNLRFSSLLRYLSSVGFKVPVRFLTVNPVPTLRAVSATSGKAKSTAKAKGHPKQAGSKSSR